MPVDRRIHPLVAAVTALAAAAAVLLGSVTPAAAHDSVRSSDPADGERLSATPSQVVVTLSATPLGADMVVTSPDGTEVQTGDAVVSGHEVVQQLSPLPAAGQYLATFRIVSSDGHSITKSISFTVEPEAVVPPPDRAGSWPNATPSVVYEGTYIPLGPDGNLPSIADADADAGARDGGDGGLVAVTLLGLLVVVGVTGGMVARRRRRVS